MNIAPDKRQHLIGGAAVAAALAGVIYLAVTFGWWAGVAAGSLAAGLGVELYQKIRREGQPDPADALASALPGLVVAAALWSIGM